MRGAPAGRELTAIDRKLVRTSKFLSLVLRHRPEVIGIELDAEGWVPVEELLARAAEAGRNIDRATLVRVVQENDKQRFTLSADGARIRAAQGHSVDVDLGLEAVEPPETLFHGTATRNLASIREHGRLPGNRQHVHLSLDEGTSRKVGTRHGKPVVLRVAARAMHEAGQTFHVSENGVWLTLTVAPEFITFPESGQDRDEIPR